MWQCKARLRYEENRRALGTKDMITFFFQFVSSPIVWVLAVKQNLSQPKLNLLLLWSRKNVGNAKCRPTIDRVSTNYWPTHRSSIDQLSTKYRQSVGEVSAKSRRSVGEQKAISAETHLERLSAMSRPSVDPLLTDCRPSVDRLSTECRPLYRPISRSTLPTVNKIQQKMKWTRDPNKSPTREGFFSMLPFDFIMYNIFDNYFGLFLGSLWNSADTMTSEWTI